MKWNGQPIYIKLWDFEQIFRIGTKVCNIYSTKPVSITPFMILSWNLKFKKQPFFYTKQTTVERQNWSVWLNGDNKTEIELIAKQS